MCDCIELKVRLRDDAGTDTLVLPRQSAHRLPNGEGTLWCHGEFPDYWIGNGSCGCGSIEGREGGPARLIPLQFVGYFLTLFPVDRVELIWWNGSSDNKPIAPPICEIPWPEFVRRNDRRQFHDGVLYVISGRPERNDPILQTGSSRTPLTHADP